MLIIICISKSFVYKSSVILLVALIVIYHRLLYMPASFFCFVCLFLWNQFHFLFCYVGAYASVYRLCQSSKFFSFYFHSVEVLQWWCSLCFCSLGSDSPVIKFQHFHEFINMQYNTSVRKRGIQKVHLKENTSVRRNLSRLFCLVSHLNILENNILENT